jgi:hypothetical protein
MAKSKYTQGRWCLCRVWHVDSPVLWTPSQLPGHLCLSPDSFPFCLHIPSQSLGLGSPFLTTPQALVFYHEIKGFCSSLFFLELNSFPELALFGLNFYFQMLITLKFVSLFWSLSKMPEVYLPALQLCVLRTDQQLLLLAGTCSCSSQDVASCFQVGINLNPTHPFFMSSWLQGFSPLLRNVTHPHHFSSIPNTVGLDHNPYQFLLFISFL